jgi:hypothetical protein
MAKSFSTDTTLSIQVPEGCQLPTTGGITSVDYSTQNVPYGFPRSKDRFDILVQINAGYTAAASTVIWLKNQIVPPIGSWKLSYELNVSQVLSGAGTNNAYYGLMTASATNPVTTDLLTSANTVVSVAEYYPVVAKSKDVNLTVATPYYINGQPIGSSFTTFGIRGVAGFLKAQNNYI